MWLFGWWADCSDLGNVSWCYSKMIYKVNNWVYIWQSVVFLDVVLCKAKKVKRG